MSQDDSTPDRNTDLSSPLFRFLLFITTAEAAPDFVSNSTKDSAAPSVPAAFSIQLLLLLILFLLFQAMSVPGVYNQAF